MEQTIATSEKSCHELFPPNTCKEKPIFRMEIIRKIFAILLLIPLAFALLFFFNPFAWGMRSEKRLDLSKQEEELKQELSLEWNQVSFKDVKMWYIKDCKRGYLDSLDNLEITIEQYEPDRLNLAKSIEEHLPKIIQTIPECTCFDSVSVQINWQEKTNFEYINRSFSKKYPIQCNGKYKQ